MRNKHIKEEMFQTMCKNLRQRSYRSRRCPHLGRAAGAAPTSGILALPAAPGLLRAVPPYSLLGSASPVSDVGSCLSSRPPDAGRPQGFEAAPVSLHVGEPIRLQMSPHGLSAAPAAPLSSRPAGCPLSPAGELDRSLPVILSSSRPQACALLPSESPFSLVALLSTSVLTPICQEPPWRPPSPHPVAPRSGGSSLQSCPGSFSFHPHGHRPSHGRLSPKLPQSAIRVCPFLPAAFQIISQTAAVVIP